MFSIFIFIVMFEFWSVGFALPLYSFMDSLFRMTEGIQIHCVGGMSINSSIMNNNMVTAEKTKIDCPPKMFSCKNEMESCLSYLYCTKLFISFNAYNPPAPPQVDTWHVLLAFWFQ